MLYRYIFHRIFSPFYEDITRYERNTLSDMDKHPFLVKGVFGSLLIHFLINMQPLVQLNVK
ncbi:hypothetical protein BW1_009_00370 [Bacillus mycoides NBRC 101238 = DSM 11821]|nr:hypothetical protein BW1_009_00370 [Bacillus mycoides NBRC 101238 = DSM 11821]